MKNIQMRQDGAVAIPEHVFNLCYVLIRCGIEPWRITALKREARRLQDEEVAGWLDGHELAWRLGVMQGFRPE